MARRQHRKPPRTTATNRLTRRRRPFLPLAPMGTAKAHPLRCFSRTHGDDGTQLTACTQPPRHHPRNRHHQRAVAVHSLASQWFRKAGQLSHGSDLDAAVSLLVVAGFFQPGRHISTARGQALAGTGTVAALRVLKHMGICVGVLDVSTQDQPAAAHARNEITKTCWRLLQ